MTIQDLYALSPELGMTGLALFLVLLDLVVRRKWALPLVAVIGMAVPLGFAISLWFDLDSSAGIVLDNSVLASTLEVDKFALFFKFLIIAATSVVVLASTGYARNFERFRAEYYSLMLFSAAGMMLLASAVELITIYVALELTALPIAALAAFNRDARSTESGMKFLILSAVSSAVLLYGMVMVYGLTGSTSLADVSARLHEIDLSLDAPFGSHALMFGVVLIIAGFGFKITSFPFQMWAPDVYEGSPTPVTAFLSVASKAAGFAVVLRVFYTAFDTLSEWGMVFAVLAALSMSIGNLIAIRQDNIKRLLAYSTIAHAGYLMVGVAAIARAADGGSSGPSGVLFYIGGYAATNLAAFTVVIAVSERIGSDAIDDFAGMAVRSPYLAGVLAFAMVSLIGLPPAVGFVTKVYIFGSAVETNLEWLAIVGVMNSVVSAYYYLRVVKVMYLSPPASREPIGPGMPLRLAVFAAFAGTAFFGVYPAPLLRLAAAAADVLTA